MFNNGLPRFFLACLSIIFLSVYDSGSYSEMLFDFTFSLEGSRKTTVLNIIYLVVLYEFAIIGIGTNTGANYFSQRNNLPLYKQ